MMKKLLLSTFLFVFFSGVVVAEKTLKPYQDYLIILVHGLNDNRTSFVGENEGLPAEVREQRDMRKWISDSLGIPVGYIWAYSYAESRGSNVENAKLLGLKGYTPALSGGGKDMGYDPFRQLVGDRAPTIEMTDHKIFNEKRMEYWSYDPALDKYIPTNIEPGHTILDQARKDFKKWYFNSDLNKINHKDPNSPRIIKDPLDPRLEALVPKKFILMPHSMGNLSTRLYIYSNELSEKGKFFDKGFYKGDVEKVVFLAAPLRGSDMAWVLVCCEVTLV